MCVFQNKLRAMNAIIIVKKINKRQFNRRYLANAQGHLEYNQYILYYRYVQFIHESLSFSVLVGVPVLWDVVRAPSNRRFVHDISLLSCYNELRRSENLFSINHRNSGVPVSMGHRSEHIEFGTVCFAESSFLVYQ